MIEIKQFTFPKLTNTNTNKILSNNCLKNISVSCAPKSILYPTKSNQFFELKNGKYKHLFNHYPPRGIMHTRTLLISIFEVDLSFCLANWEPHWMQIHLTFWNPVYPKKYTSYPVCISFVFFVNPISVLLPAIQNF